MSLTGHLKEKASPVRKFFADHFPNIGLQQFRLRPDFLFFNLLFQDGRSVGIASTPFRASLRRLSPSSPIWGASTASGRTSACAAFSHSRSLPAPSEWCAVLAGSIPQLRVDAAWEI